MRTRSIGFALVVTLGIITAACGGSGASTAPSQAASQAAGSSVPGGGSGQWKIGVVTDVGTVNDKNFNEYTYAGAKNGAATVGAAEPPYFVPKDASEYTKGLQGYVDQGFNIIVTAGFNLGNETTKFAKANPNVWFVGVDQGPPCVDKAGAPDASFKCEGDAATLLPHYVALSYQEDQAGYLAGMVAGTITKTGTIGAIGGITLCGPCIRYIQGYELGAKSIKADVAVKSAYVTDSDFVKAFNDPVTGKAFGKQFIEQQKPDVLFQVAGKTGNGILDAACDAGISGVGVDVDQSLSYPNAAKCIVTSAEKKLSLAVETDIKGIVAGTQKGGDDHWDAKRQGIGLSPFHDLASVIPGDLQAKLDKAFADMVAGTLKTCPANCGKLK
jgi:basic membrane protein A and related proteins